MESAEIKNISALLKEGKALKELSLLSVYPSYGSLCKIIRKVNISGKGVLVDRNLSYTPEFKEYLYFLSSTFKNLQEIADFLGTQRDKLAGIYATAGLQIKWRLEDNHNDLLAASRKAELFVKNLGYRVIRDCYTCASAEGTKAPYDLILEHYGSCDVKSTVIKSTPEGRKYASFNVQNFTKGVKHAFLVVMTEQRDDFVMCFAVPGKLVFGHSTISISLNPISNKYSNYLIWSNNEIKDSVL